MRAIVSSVAVLVLLAVLQSASAASIFDLIGASVTGLVTDQEEVPYTVIKNEAGYEERMYPAQAWVCKNHSGSLTASAQQAAFLSLFDYLNKENTQNLDLDMAIPVSVRAPGDPSVNMFEACFYPGSSYQDNVPQPTNHELFVKHRPQMTIFTKKFGGYATEEQVWRTATQDLTQVLDAAGEQYSKDLYYWNAYDSPVKFWNRRNEVWILKKE